MLIFAGVDGTGTHVNAIYSLEFANSIVQRLYRSWRGVGPAQYQRGPTNLGFSTSDLARTAAKFVETQWNQEWARNPRYTGAPRISVFLAGYSRGGAAIIETCHHLKDLGIEVQCLVLCDAVERTLGYNWTTIPSNVRLCFHAVRDPYTFSRRWMGNCGRQIENRQITDYRERMFHCTHGGVGGTPWFKPGASGSIEEDFAFADGETLRYASHMVKKYLPGTYDDYLGNSGKTNITPELDYLVSEQVWNWANTAFRDTLRRLSANLGTIGSSRPGATIDHAGY